MVLTEIFRLPECVAKRQSESYVGANPGTVCSLSRSCKRVFYVLFKILCKTSCVADGTNEGSSL